MANLTEPYPLELPEFTVLRSHAPQVHTNFHAIVTDSSSVICAIQCIEISLIYSSMAIFAVHVFKVVILLHFLLYISALFSAHSIIENYLFDLLLAERTRIFHLDDPFLDTWMAKFVIAIIQPSFFLQCNLLETDAASTKLF